MTRCIRGISLISVPGAAVGSGAGPAAAAVGLAVGLGVAPLHGGPDVPLDDAARRARALYLGEVEVVLPGQALHYGRGPEAAVGPTVLLGGRFLRSLRGGRGPGLAAPICFLAAPGLFLGPFGLLRPAVAALGDLLALALDKRYRLADGDVLPLVGHQLREGAGVLCLQLQRDLVGLDLGYRVALGDLVTLALEPLDEGALLHRVAHLGHDHFRHFTSPPCKERDGPHSLPASRSGRRPAPDSARTAQAPRPRSPSRQERPENRTPCP